MKIKCEMRKCEKEIKSRKKKKRTIQTRMKM